MRHNVANIARMSDDILKLSCADAIFVTEYTTNGGNGTEAAMRAWPTIKRSSASVKANERLNDPMIIRAIMGEKMEIIERSRYTAAQLLDRLMDDVNADVSDLYDEHGQLLPIKDWPMVWRQGLVTAIETEAGDVTKIKTADRTRLKDMLGKHISVKAWEKDTTPGEIHVHISGKDSKL